MYRWPVALEGPGAQEPNPSALSFGPGGRLPKRSPLRSERRRREQHIVVPAKRVEVLLNAMKSQGKESRSLDESDW